MKVLGYTDEVTTCDCCGKRNLKGSFAIETDEGATVHFGSVCVNRAYGRKAASGIKFMAEQIRKANVGSWEGAVDRLSRGMLQPFVGVKADGRMAMDNSRATMAAVVAIKDIKSGQIIRAKI